jgi:hypothetical protein
MQEVSGSIPLGSTIFSLIKSKPKSKVFAVFFRAIVATGRHELPRFAVLRTPLRTP